MTGQENIQDRMQTSAGSIATVGALFRSCAALHGAAVALEYRGRRISYAELLDRVQRPTAMLIAQGLQRGDRVALLSRNRPEYFEIELAAARQHVGAERRRELRLTAEAHGLTICGLHWLLAKTEVNGAGRHPLYDVLTAVADGDGEAGDIQWNFEKFLVSPGGDVVRRFRPGTTPEDPELVKAMDLPRQVLDAMIDKAFGKG